MKKPETLIPEYISKNSTEELSKTIQLQFDMYKDLLYISLELHSRGG